jgi:hypothetical protein
VAPVSGLLRAARAVTAAKRRGTTAPRPPTRRGGASDQPRVRFEETLTTGEWVDAHSIYPAWFDEVEYRDDAWMIPDPDRGEIGVVTNSGARGAAWREFPSQLAGGFSASCMWTGQRPYEGSPLIHVNPDDANFGIGLWPIADFAKLDSGPIPTWLLGVIGRKPSEFDSLPKAWTRGEVDHVDGTPQRLELRSNGVEVSAWVDGSRILGPVAIPAGLLGSSRHGICLDVNQDPSRPAHVPVLSGPLLVESLGELDPI